MASTATKVNNCFTFFLKITRLREPRKPRMTAASHFLPCMAAMHNVSALTTPKSTAVRFMNNLSNL
jgi:hypothetical protein